MRMQAVDQIAAMTWSPSTVLIACASAWKANKAIVMLTTTPTPFHPMYRRTVRLSQALMRSIGLHLNGGHARRTRDSPIPLPIASLLRQRRVNRRQRQEWRQTAATEMLWDFENGRPLITPGQCLERDDP
jgi:hypothetical protein